MSRYLDAARETNRQVAGVMRAVDLPHRLRAAGLGNVKAMTTIIERFGPLDAVEKAALGDLIEFTAKTALRADIPQDDVAVWDRLLQRLQNERLLDQPGFYIREGAVVTAGHVH